MVSAFIGRIIALCSRYAWFIIIFYAILSVLSVVISARKLDITTDTTKMFSTSMAWKQRSDWMGKAFPQRENLLVTLIEAKLPEEGELTAKALVERLQADTEHFTFVQSPESNPYLIKNGLLFLDPPVLEDTLNSIVKAQPFLSGLAVDPSARGLFDALNLITLGLKEGGVDLTLYHDALHSFADALESEANGKRQYFSWEMSMSGQLVNLIGKYQFVIAKPKLNLNSLQPSGAAAEKLRQIISELEFVKSGDVKTYITGDAQINDEEFSTVMHGMVAGLFASFVLVAIWLFFAVRTWRIILPILLVLIVGLLLTTWFAAMAVGTLNLISVAFAILFISIAVDFAIQFSVRFRGQVAVSLKENNIQHALVKTGYETGKQIFIAAFAAAAGFLAFTPTKFIGVKQLGLISGVGMLIALVCTLTLLPAFLTILRPNVVYKMAGFPKLRGLDVKVRRYRYGIIAVYGVIAAIGIFLLVDQKVTFDADPFHTKDSHSEGMRALQLLMEDPHLSPYTADVIVDSPEKAKAVADRLSDLSMVRDVVWRDSLVPEDQEVKLPMLQNVATILLPTLIVNNPTPQPTPAELRQSIAKLVQGLDEVKSKTAKASPLRRIHRALKKIENLPDADLMRVNYDLVRFLPFQLDRLKTMLTAQTVTTRDIPNDLLQDYQTHDGKLRLEVYPKSRLKNNQEITEFVNQIRTVAPDAAGTTVDIIESAKTVVDAFRVAALMAIATLALILFLALRRLLDMFLVLMPLILSGLMTVIVIVVLQLPLNFANIITLPLLLGVGVSFNIYFVMNWREGLHFPLSSPTARAVLFSALTTGTAFSALAASAHPGTASMGYLLLISLGCTLLATLIFVPAILPKRKVDLE